MLTASFSFPKQNKWYTRTHNKQSLDSPSLSLSLNHFDLCLSIELDRLLFSTVPIIKFRFYHKSKLLSINKDKICYKFSNYIKCHCASLVLCKYEFRLAARLGVCFYEKKKWEIFFKDERIAKQSKCVDIFGCNKPIFSINVRAWNTFFKRKDIAHIHYTHGHGTAPLKEKAHKS